VYPCPFEVETFQLQFVEPYRQGDQIGRIFAQWGIVYFGQFLENYIIFWILFFYGKSFDKKWVGIHFGRLKTPHLVTLLTTGTFHYMSCM
jgi:hypothetical protein